MSKLTENLLDVLSIGWDNADALEIEVNNYKAKQSELTFAFLKTLLNQCCFHIYLKSKC